jgi:PhnB protein
MSNQVTPIPEGYHTITPYLIVKDGAGAVAFYEKAFKAERKEVMQDDSGNIRHAELKIGDSMLMLGQHDQVEDRSEKLFPRVSIYLYVPNVDELVASAEAAGAKITQPVSTKFYGNREGGIEDPYGIVWWVATRVELVSAEETARRAAEHKPA